MYNYPNILIFIVSCNIILDSQCAIIVMRLAGEDIVTPFIPESGYGLQLGCKIYICGHAVWHSVPGNSKCRCEYYNMLLSICVKWIKTCMKYPITDRGYLCISYYSHYFYIYTTQYNTSSTKLLLTVTTIIYEAKISTPTQVAICVIIIFIFGCNWVHSLYKYLPNIHYYWYLCGELPCAQCIFGCSFGAN